jgi:hypothetical protein
MFGGASLVSPISDDLVDRVTLLTRNERVQDGSYGHCHHKRPDDEDEKCEACIIHDVSSPYRMW